MGGGMSEEVFSFIEYRDREHQRILEAQPTRAELLEELRQSLRLSRTSLSVYRDYQEPARYAMTVEDLDEHEDAYARLMNDVNGIYDYEDYVEAVVNANCTGVVIAYVLEQGVRRRAELTRDPGKPRGASGCIVIGLTLVSIPVSLGLLAAVNL